MKNSKPNPDEPSPLMFAIGMFIATIITVTLFCFFVIVRAKTLIQQ